MGDDVIEAAGGVVWRRADDGAGVELEVLVVHRPKYDDWSLPKGKLDPGETHEHAALREVEEETGLRCTLGRELPEVRYEFAGRPKRVRYWTMTVDAGAFEPNREVDEVRWLPVDTAADLLTRAGDAAVLDALGEAIS